jgi:hypothetical protein
VPSAPQTDDALVRQALAEAFPDDAARSAGAMEHAVTVIRVTATALETGGGQFPVRRGRAHGACRTA